MRNKRQTRLTKSVGRDVSGACGAWLDVDYEAPVDLKVFSASCTHKCHTPSHAWSNFA